MIERRAGLSTFSAPAGTEHQVARGTAQHSRRPARPGTAPGSDERGAVFPRDQRGRCPPRLPAEHHQPPPLELRLSSRPSWPSRTWRPSRSLCEASSAVTFESLCWPGGDGAVHAHRQRRRRPSRLARPISETCRLGTASRSSKPETTDSAWSLRGDSSEPRRPEPGRVQPIGCRQMREFGRRLPPRTIGPPISGERRT